MHFFNLSQFFKFSQFFNEMKNNEEESFLSSVKCRIRTVYYGLVLYLIEFQLFPPLWKAVPGNTVPDLNEAKFGNFLAQICP